jgi:hypothetical protein
MPIAGEVIAAGPTIRRSAANRIARTNIQFDKMIGPKEYRTDWYGFISYRGVMFSARDSRIRYCTVNEQLATKGETAKWHDWREIRSPQLDSFVSWEVYDGKLYWYGVRAKWEVLITPQAESAPSVDEVYDRDTCVRWIINQLTPRFQLVEYL